MKDIWRGLMLVILFMNGCALLPAQIPLVKAKHLTWNVLYDYNRMSPAVVWYVLDESDFRGSISTKSTYFKMDTKLPPPRVKDKYLRKSGYERGHLCPSGDRDSRKDWFKDTFYTSNVVLMTTAVNAGVWRDIEILCRRLAVGGHRLFIAAGPVWYQTTAVSNTDSHGNTRVSITDRSRVAADGFFKVCSCLTHPGEKICWFIPNGDSWVNEKDCRVQMDSLICRYGVDILKYYDSWKNQ